MKNTDKNIQQKISELSNQDLPFDEANLWHRLEEKLDKKSPKIAFFYWQRWVAAASILLFLGVGFVVFNLKSKENLVENFVKKESKKNIQDTDNQLVIKYEKLKSQKNLKQEIVETTPKKPFEKSENFTNNENLKAEVLVQENEEKTDFLPKTEILKVNEIQTKKVIFEAKNIDIKTPILALKNEAETPEKPRRRFAFSIKIFPSLTTPDTVRTPVYAYGESTYQVKIKF